MSSIYDVTFAPGMAMAFGTSAVFLPKTEWAQAAGIKDARAYIEVIGIDGELEIAPAIQVADHPDSPGAATAIGPYRTSNDVWYSDGWTLLTGQTDDSKLARFGWLVKLTNTGSPGAAWVQGTINVRTD